MQFIHPAFLYLGLLAAVPLVLYLFRRKSRQIDVSTLVFFKTLAKEHQESAWLRRLKKLLSFLLTLALLLLAVLALAQLVLAPAAEETRTVVVLFDRSASMAVEDEEGRSRLEEARRQLDARLDALPEDVGVALVAYDTRHEVLLPRSLNRRELRSKIADLEARPQRQSGDAAMKTALTLAQLETPAVVWHFSDREFWRPLDDQDGAGTSTDESPEADAAGEAELVVGGETPENTEGDAEASVDGSAADTGGADEGGTEESRDGESFFAARELPEGVRVEFINVALPEAVNVGFTAFRIRPVPLVHNRYELFVKVSCNLAAEEAVQARIEVSLGGMPVQLREIDLEPGESQSLVLPIDGSEGQVLHLSLRAPDDCLPADNDLLAALPRSRPVVAALISEDPDPYTQLALAAIQEQGELQMLQGGPDAWPIEDGVDVVVFDGWVPDPWPADLPAVVINPPRSVGPLRSRILDGGGLPHDSVRVGNEEHPILFRVSSQRVALTQTCLFDTVGSLEPLWMAGNEPVLAAGEVKGQRLVLMGFSAQRSEQLPMMASYPILMANAILWCAETSEAVRERVRENRSGDLVSLEADRISWSEWRGDQVRRSEMDLEDSLLVLDRQGVWESDSGERGMVHLLSGEETDIPVRGELSSEEVNGDTISGGGWLQGDITWLLLGLLAGILVLESLLFHRFSVY